MTQMRCASWREVSGHAKVQNKAETMPKVHLNEVKAPSMIREQKQPESNRQPCTQRTDLKDLKGDISKNVSLDLSQSVECHMYPIATVVVVAASMLHSVH